MSEERLGKLESAVGDMTLSMNSLVLELRHSNENFKTQQSQHKEEISELKVMIKELDSRQQAVERKMPLIDEWRSNSNKVRTTVTAGIILASIIGGIIGRYT